MTKTTTYVKWKSALYGITVADFKIISYYTEPETYSALQVESKNASAPTQ